MQGKDESDDGAALGCTAVFGCEIVDIIPGSEDCVCLAFLTLVSGGGGAVQDGLQVHKDPVAALPAPSPRLPDLRGAPQSSLSPRREAPPTFQQPHQESSAFRSRRRIFSSRADRGCSSAAAVLSSSLRNDGPLFFSPQINTSFYKEFLGCRCLFTHQVTRKLVKAAHGACIRANTITPNNISIWSSGGVFPSYELLIAGVSSCYR